jgi:mannose-1-phosphate guanylyltransferase
MRFSDKPGIPEVPNARVVLILKEKPNLRTAAAYIAMGSYRWNAGMFVTKASFLLELLGEY